MLGTYNPKEKPKYNLHHQHHVSVQRFETYYMKNSISSEDLLFGIF